MSISLRSFALSPLGSPLRWVALAASVTALAAHLPITEDHLEEAFYIGVLFIVLEVACACLAALLPARDTRLVWYAVTATGTTSVLTYVLSRSIGLPQITDDVGNWTDPLGYVAVASETIMVLLGVVALRTRRTAPSPLRVTPIVSGAIALTFGLAMTGLAANASQGMVAPSQARHMQMGSMSGKGYWQGVGGDEFKWSGVTRTYYISADEVEWNYAPAGKDLITGEPFDDVANVFVQNGPNRIGSTYRKCIYRGYTDSSFTHLEKRPASESYLGLLGPVIHAVVGDKVDVVFRNSCSIPASVHVHGLLYNKASEGAPYNDGTQGSQKADDEVAPGGHYTYHWRVAPRSGPAEGDTSSVMWMYHGHADEVGETYAGLMGPVVVTAPGMARADGTPKDVDKEVFALFSVMNENASPYEQYNLHHYAQPPQIGSEDPDYEESNLMHSINGYVYGNQPMISLHKGEHVRWYTMGMGTEVDLHTPHWHGNDVVANGMRTDVVNLLPATMVVADMVPDDPGIWLFHCHVNDHIVAGMMTRYQVTH